MLGTISNLISDMEDISKEIKQAKLNSEEKIALEDLACWCEDLAKEINEILEN